MNYKPTCRVFYSLHLNFKVHSPSIFTSIRNFHATLA